MVGIIYKITCKVNGKVYIGQTTGTLEHRFEGHIKSAFSENNKLKIKFQRAIRKYGKDNFMIEEIDKASSREELNEKEKYWIAKYDSINSGYNTALGGEGGNTYAGIDEEQMNVIKQKISLANKGRNNGMSRQIKAFSVKLNKEFFFNTLGECLQFLNIKNKSIVMNRALKKVTTLWRHEWKFALEDEDYGEFTDEEDYDASLRKGIKVTLTKDGVSRVFNSKQKAIEFLNLKKGQLVNNSIINNYLVQFP